MFRSLFQFLFGCRHRRFTRPMTAPNADGTPESYVVCLDCAARLAFDAREMRVGSVLPRT